MGCQLALRADSGLCKKIEHHSGYLHTNHTTPKDAKKVCLVCCNVALRNAMLVLQRSAAMAFHECEREKPSAEGF